MECCDICVESFSLDSCVMQQCKSALDSRTLALSTYTYDMSVDLVVPANSLKNGGGTGMLRDYDFPFQLPDERIPSWTN